MSQFHIYIFSLLAMTFLFGCQNIDPITEYGLHYQKHKDYQSLSKVVELMKPGSDTSYVRKILGEPIDMGFDFRYLIDSTGVNDCVLGAVFHIDETGHIDQQWLDEICE